MKCSGCKEEFPNLARLKEHKPNCPAAIAPKVKAQDPFVIPLNLCPPEIKLYAKGKVLGLQVTGKFVDEGVELQEVKLVR